MLEAIFSYIAILAIAVLFIMLYQVLLKLLGISKIRYTDSKHWRITYIDLICHTLISCFEPTDNDEHHYKTVFKPKHCKINNEKKHIDAVEYFGDNLYVHATDGTVSNNINAIHVDADTLKDILKTIYKQTK